MLGTAVVSYINDQGGKENGFVATRVEDSWTTDSNGDLVSGKIAWWEFYWRFYPSHRIWQIGCPLWVLFMVFAAVPVTNIVLWVKAKPNTGRCLACGYDLHGSTGSETCPECGEGIGRSVDADTVKKHD